MAIWAPILLQPWLERTVIGILDYSKWSNLTPPTYSFGKTADTLKWTIQEKGAIHKAFTAWSNVTNIQFQPSALGDTGDIVIFKEDEFFEDWLRPSDGGLGYFPHAGGDIYYNSSHPAWATSRGIGGNAFYLILHEIGHTLGLVHSEDSLGENDDLLNTVMSYKSNKFDFSADNSQHGFVAGPMAIDIAAIQFLYGENWTYHTGDNVYVLPVANMKEYWTCIWDAGGHDKIVVPQTYSGEKTVHIDLREASLRGENPGGEKSWINGIHGGFTIANKAEIEDATGGKGKDLISGNGLRNTLEGLGGNDEVQGRANADTIYGGAGTDKLYGDLVRDEKFYDAPTTMVDFGRGPNSLADETLFVTGGPLRIFELFSTDGKFKIPVSGEFDPLKAKDQVWGEEGLDRLWGGEGADKLYGGNNIDWLAGGNGQDILEGGSRGDLLNGGPGVDTLKGGIGADKYFCLDAKIDIVEDVPYGQDILYFNKSTIKLDSSLDNNESNLLLGVERFQYVGLTPLNMQVFSDVENSFSLNVGQYGSNVTVKNDGGVITLGNGSDVVSILPTPDNSTITRHDIHEFDGAGNDKLDFTSFRAPMDGANIPDIHDVTGRFHFVGNTGAIVQVWIYEFSPHSDIDDGELLGLFQVHGKDVDVTDFEF